MSSAQYHPHHDRTSCSDDHPVNTDAEGSTGCARCTALALDRGAEAIQMIRDLLASPTTTEYKLSVYKRMEQLIERIDSINPNGECNDD